MNGFTDQMPEKSAEGRSGDGGGVAVKIKRECHNVFVIRTNKACQHGNER
jgi:hypothetical protein